MNTIRTPKPWLNIWLTPRTTLRGIIEENPEKYVLLLAILAGLGQVMQKAVPNTLGNRFVSNDALILAFIYGPIAGIISVYSGGAIFRWSGQIFSGKAAPKEVRAALAWASIPQILSSFIVIPVQILLFGNIASFPEELSTPILLTLTGINLILTIWSILLYILCLAEVHQLRFWEGFATLLLPILLFLVLSSCFLLSPI